MFTAVVLAGGESSRLRPLGDKSLQRFLGKTLLRRHLETLAQAGFARFVIVTSPRNDAAARAECSDIAQDALVFVSQIEPRGMGDAVLRALQAIPPNEPLYLTQAHDLLAPDFHRRLGAEALDSPQAIRIAAKRVESYFPGGYLALADGVTASDSEAFAVKSIVEKPNPGEEPSNWVTLVAHYLPRAADLAAALHAEAGQHPDDWYERALGNLMRHHLTLAVPHPQPSASLKYPWHMLDILELLFGRLTEPQIHPSARIDPTATIIGPVIIEAGARIFAGATVNGPAYIGRDAILGNLALVRDASIGARSVIGFGCEVARSWVGDDVWFHTSYVGDSVIDDNVTFGYGSVTSNVRLDDQFVKVTVKGERISTGRKKMGQIVGTGARIGVNAALMPGCVIGRHTLVGPGVVLRADVPDNQRVLVRQDLVWEDNRRQPPPHGE